MSISFYLSRIRKLFDCSDTCAVVALVYVDRASRCDPDIAINELTCHRLLLACMMLAAKFADDWYYRTDHYAVTGYMEPSELVVLEKELLRTLAWRLHLAPGEYERYRDELISEASVP